MSDLLITPGQTERFAAFFKDGAGVAINLTGTTVTLESDGDPIPATVVIEDAAAGEVSVAIAANDTAAITKAQRVRFKRVSGDTYLEAWFWLQPE